LNRLIGASAGSGKTHALTTQYLRLLRERHRTVEDREGGDPLGVASLLAATFTRKAAGEIFDRLLTRLAAAALHADGLASLQAALDDPSLTTDHCRALLSGLCRSLHRVRIGTLDSFFGRLVRLYHREAGLCAHARLTYSQDPRCRALAREALRATLDTLGGRGEVAALFQALRRQEAPATVWPDLLDLLQDIAEDVHGASPEHWERLPVPPTPSQAEIDAALSALNAYTPTDKRWSNAVRGDMENFREGDWEKFLAAGLAKACLDVTPQYYGKPVPGAVVAAYAVLVGVARHVLLTELREQTLAIRALHHEFSTRYAALRRVEGLVLFSETPLLLKDAVGDGADAAGRLGASLEHLLLDEFQDTGDAQWGLLRGFALRASRAPGSVFVVADAKQALYAWRGGRAELFGCLEREIAPASRETLGRSYRSSAVVLAVVNAVFRTLAGNETLAGHA
jgi:ATP-dependent exoDNAse (exonuclease V) beta subunit